MEFEPNSENFKFEQNLAQIPHILSGDFGWRVVLCSNISSQEELPGYYTQRKLKSFDLIFSGFALMLFTRITNGYKFATGDKG